MLDSHWNRSSAGAGLYAGSVRSFPPPPFFWAATYTKCWNSPHREWRIKSKCQETKAVSREKHRSVESWGVLLLYSVDLSLEAASPRPPFFSLYIWSIVVGIIVIIKKKIHTEWIKYSKRHFSHTLTKVRSQAQAFFSFHLKTRLWYFSWKESRLQHHPGMCVYVRAPPSDRLTRPSGATRAPRPHPHAHHQNF